jgi:hypothetical protein
MISWWCLGPIWDRGTSKRSSSTSNRSKLLDDAINCRNSTYGVIATAPITCVKSEIRIPTSPLVTNWLATACSRICILPLSLTSPLSSNCV